MTQIVRFVLKVSFLFFCFQNSAYAFNPFPDYSGKLAFESSIFPSQNQADRRAVGFYDLELDRSWGYSSATKFNLEFRAQNFTDENWIQSSDRVFFQNTGVTLRSSAISFFAGSMAPEWTGTDGINPMDLATMKSYARPLKARSRGSLGIRLTASFDSGLIEGFFIPYQNGSQLPGPESNWWPRSFDFPLNIQSTVLKLPDNPSYFFRERKILDRSHLNNFGIYSAWNLGILDFSFGFFDGLAQIPLVQPLINGELTEVSPQLIITSRNPLEIQITDYRRQSLGTAGSLDMNGWILRWASRFELPRWSAASLVRSRWESSLGVERMLQVGGKDHIWILTVGGSRSYQVPGVDGLIDSEASAFSFANGFERYALTSLVTQLTSTLSSEISLLFDTQQNSQILRGQIQKSYRQNTSFVLNLESLKGPSNSLIGSWSHQSAATLGMSYNF